jgi:hypothetical protein
MDEQTSERERQPAEETPDASEATADLAVPAGEADKVKGGVIAPCDRAKK